MKMNEARKQIEAILAQIPTQDLPRWRDKDDCIWFENLSTGWIKATNPEGLGARQIHMVFAAEAAGRELARRAALPADEPSHEQAELDLGGAS